MTDAICPELDYHIAICGGGMAGASLALLCARANPHWRIALFESLPVAAGAYQPSFDARSTALSAGSMGIFAALGLADELLQEATDINTVHVSDRGHLPGQTLHGDTGPLGYVIPNAWLGRILWARLQHEPAVSILSGAVAKLKPGVGHCRVQTHEPAATFNAAVAVIADGADSALRQALGIKVTQKSYRQRAIIANLKSAKPHRGVAFERFTASGPLAFLPQGKGTDARELSLVWTLPESEADAVLALPAQDFLKRLQQQAGYRLGRLTEVGQRESYPLRLQIAREQVRSSVVLLGNAAHFLHPVAGQGFNLTLRDAAALAATWQEANGKGEALGNLAVLQRYCQRQQADQFQTSTLADSLVKLFSSPGLAQITLRHLGLLGLELTPPLKRQLHRQMAGLAGVDYTQQLGAHAPDETYERD